MLSTQQMLLGAIPGSTAALDYPDMGLGRSMVAGSMYINGGNSTVVPNSDGALAVGTGDYCIEWWQWLDTNTTGNGRQWQIGNWPYAAFGVSMEGNSSYRSFYFWASSSIQISYSFNTAQMKNFFKRWHHCCVERVSGVTSIYLDGTMLAQSNNSYNVTSTSDLRIGAEGNGASAMTGYISDFHVVKGAYKYNGNFTPPYTSITATANTTLLLNMVSDFTDSSSNNKTLSATSAWDWRGPYLAPQIWLDGSSYSYPGSGNIWSNLGRHDCYATLNGSMGTFEDAMDFNNHFGDNSAYAQLLGGTYPILTNMTRGITVIAVYDLMSSNNFERIIDFGSGAPSNNIILCRLSTSDNLIWDVYNPITDRSAIVTGAAASGKKMAVALSSPGSTVMYSGSGGDSTSGITLKNGPRANLYIGRSNWGSDDYLHGKIYHLSIYDRILNNDEIGIAQSKLTSWYSL